MVMTENARVIGVEELKEILEEEYENPTVERLMFIETKGKEDKPGKIFPCFVEAWGEEENAEVKTDPGLRFQLCIIQSSGGEFGMVRVIVMANDIGVTKRIWDKPPAKGAREYIPWANLEEGVQ